MEKYGRSCGGRAAGGASQRLGSCRSTFRKVRPARDVLLALPTEKSRGKSSGGGPPATSHQAHQAHQLALPVPFALFDGGDQQRQYRPRG